MKNKLIALMLCTGLLSVSFCSCGSTDGGNNSSSSDTGSAVSSCADVIDLTKLDGTMMYAQINDMINNPDSYNGKTIIAKGPFNYFKNESGNEYFAVLVSDTTACCVQGIEFRLKGDHEYPQDYPADKTEIIIKGICDIYEEGGGTYCQLLDAEYETA